MLENIGVRSNWIRNLVHCVDLEDKIGNDKQFKKVPSFYIDDAYHTHWTTGLRKPDSNRLSFHRKWKITTNLEDRKSISKIRCFDHYLEI